MDEMDEFMKYKKLNVSLDKNTVHNKGYASFPYIEYGPHTNYFR